MKKIIAANWKMNETRAQGEALARSVAEGIASLPDDRKVVIFPPATALDIVTGASMGRFETRAAAAEAVLKPLGGHCAVLP